MLTYPSFQDYLQNPSASVRGMVIQAMRYTFADSDETFDYVLKPVVIGTLTTMLNDSDLENRRLALTALNSATHNKPEIILSHLHQLLPLVMKESVVRPELVREVQMGPFKHKVDDGLEVRKVNLEHTTTQCRPINTEYVYRVPMRLFTRFWRMPSPASTSLTSSIESLPGSEMSTISACYVTSC